MRPQALPPSPQPSTSVFPALDSRDMMPAITAASTPWFRAAVLMRDLYFSTLPASVSAIACEAFTPLTRNQTHKDSVTSVQPLMWMWSTLFCKCLPEDPSLSWFAVTLEAPVVPTREITPSLKCEMLRCTIETHGDTGDLWCFSSFLPLKQCNNVENQCLKNARVSNDEAQKCIITKCTYSSLLPSCEDGAAQLPLKTCCENRTQQETGLYTLLRPRFHFHFDS